MCEICLWHVRFKSQAFAIPDNLRDNKLFIVVLVKSADFESLSGFADFQYYAGFGLPPADKPIALNCCLHIFDGFPNNVESVSASLTMTNLFDGQFDSTAIT